jgi:hypothetical protein
MIKTTNAFIKVFTQDYSCIAFIMSFIGFCVCYYLKNTVGLYGSAVILFSAFDVLGFFYILTRYQSEQPSNFAEFNIAYRLMQTVFQIFLAFIMLLISPIVAACFILTWWFGACDALFYILLKQQFIGYQNMTWLWWSLPGIIHGKNTTGRDLALFSVLGVVISLILIIYVKL